MMSYILRAALLIAASLLFYKIWLGKETFYRLNRLILIFCLALSFTLPLIPVPQSWALLNDRENNEFVTGNRAVSNNIAADDAKGNKDKVFTTIHEVPVTQRVIHWISYLYWAGVIIFALNFLIQLAVLYLQAYRNAAVKDKIFRIVEINSNRPPCSFANNIFINPSNYDWDTYDQILVHEKVHVRQWHTMDIVLMQLVLMFQWFNPFAWLYRKELENNLEFLTDDCVLNQNSIPKESYQQNLVKVSAPYLSLGITINYNTSLLKKRIVMMNAKKSTVSTLWKYFFLVPVFVCLVCLINNPATGKQTARSTLSSVPKNISPPVTQAAQNLPAHNVEGAAMYDTAKTAVRKAAGPDTLLLNTATITPEFIKSFENIGYDHIPAETLAAFKAYGITADFAKSFWPVGYDKIPVQQLLSLKQLNITPDYIRSFWRVDYVNVPLTQLIKLKEKNITPGQVAALENLGYKKNSVDSLLGIQ